MFSLLAMMALAPAGPIHSTRCEVVVTTTAEPANPDLVAVTFDFTDGKSTVSVPGFWDGGGAWRARARLAPGEWQYLVSSKPPIQGIEGATGRVIAKDVARNEFDRRGPLKPNAPGTHFVHADGTPFFWMGDACWNGPLFAAPGDWQHYLTTRQRQRFSVIQFTMIAPWTGAASDAESRQAFRRRERVEIEPEFFRRVDERIDTINGKGLLAAPVILWAATGADNPGFGLNAEQVAFISRYVYARYHAHDVAWLLAGDGKYGGAGVARWTKIGRSVFGDQPENPVTLHPAKLHWPFEEYRKEPWLGFCGYNTGLGDNDDTNAWTHSGDQAKNWRQQPVRPILNLDLPWEGSVSEHAKQSLMDFAVRRSLWWSLLSTPIAGFTYGAHGVATWQAGPGFPRARPYSGVAPIWHTAIDTPGARQLKLLRDFLDTLPWTEFRPAQELLATQPGERVPERFVSVAKGSAAILAYIPTGSKIAFKPDAVPAGATASWYDPRSGKLGPAIPATAEMTTPDAKDWVLLIRLTP